MVIGRAALRTISWSFPVAAVCITLSSAFQALGNGIYSTITSLCRQMFVLLPVAYLMSLTGNVNNVWLATSGISNPNKLAIVPARIRITFVTAIA